MNKFIPKPLPIKMLKRLVDSEEINEISKKIDLISSDNAYLPHFIDEHSKLDVAIGESTSSTWSNVSVEFVTVDPTCLLVEDSTSVSKAMSRCMERKGWKCSLAKDGEEGLRLLKARNWDAVFMDDQLPLLTGVRCISKFREWETINRVARQKNVYLCSADSEHDCSSPSSGFDGFFVKPFKPAMLGKVLDACIENGKSTSFV
jgi:CheY-like chemotaxis protein